MTLLLDGNVLVALMLKEHEFHDRCSAWLQFSRSQKRQLVTCPLTEGTLLRLHMQLDPTRSPALAWESLEHIRRLVAPETWLDNFSYRDVPHPYLQGHRQVTDAWLVELARRHKGKLATLDAALATLYPAETELIPVVL